MKTACFLLIVLLFVVDWSSASDQQQRRCSRKLDCEDSECCSGANNQLTRCRRLGQNGDDCLTNITDCQNTCLRCPCAANLRCIPKNDADNEDVAQSKSCKGRCALFVTKEDNPTCQCDGLCKRKGDCCKDYHRLCKTKIKKEESTELAEWVGSTVGAVFALVIIMAVAYFIAMRVKENKKKKKRAAEQLESAELSVSLNRPGVGPEQQQQQQQPDQPPTTPADRFAATAITEEPSPEGQTAGERRQSTPV